MLSLTGAAAWPVDWSRTLRSHQDVARANALAAARALAERRREREDVERYLADRAARQDLRRRRSS